MAKIESISFENFRVFKDKTTFELAPITILTGTNSSGKSSFVKGLKLIKDSYLDAENHHLLKFQESINDSYHHQLGNFDMIISDENQENQEITLTYEFYNYFWGDMYLENTYVLDNDSKYKNGLLKKSSLFFKADEKAVLIIEKTDFSNHIRYYPDNAKCKYFNIKEVLKRVSSNMNEFQYFADNLGNALLITFDFNKLYEYIPFEAPRLIHLFSDINKEDFNDLEKALWEQIIKEKLNSNYSYESFLELIKKVDDYFLIPITDLSGVMTMRYLYGENYLIFDSIKKYFVENIGTDFNSFYQELKEQILEEMSLNYISEMNFMFYKKQFPKFNILYGMFCYFQVLEFYLVNLKLEEIDKPRRIKRFSESNHFVEVSGIDFLEYMKDLEVEDFYGFIDYISNSIENHTFEKLESFFQNLLFVGVERVTSKRLYKFESQGTPLNKLLSDFLDSKYIDKAIDFLNKWIKEFELGDKIDFSVQNDGLGVQILIVKGDKIINIVDLGYGVTQLITLLLSIVSAEGAEVKTIVIEAPEINLHPKLQSKLADLFLEAYHELDLNFILETHSKYLIKRLQVLTAKQKIKTDTTIIHYIGNTTEINESVRTIRIKPTGLLDKPFGNEYYDKDSSLTFTQSELDFS